MAERLLCGAGTMRPGSVPEGAPPLVSIITPLYECGPYVRETLASVQAQTLADFEHIVVDNMSTDDGPAIAREMAATDPRIRFLENRQSRGAGPTRNVGIAAARGRYIAFLDADDTWLPEKLARQIAAMQARRAAFSWTAYTIVDAGGKARRVQRVLEQAGPGDLLSRRLVIGCLTAVYDAHILGKREMTAGDGPEDFCLWMDILAFCAARDLEVVGLDEVLACYRVHPRGSSRDKRVAAWRFWAACRGHLGMSRARSARAFATYAWRSMMARLG